MSVLVLDGHSRAALETVQALGRAGNEIHLAAETQECLGFHSRYVRRRYLQPEPQDCHSWLQQLDIQNRYDLIVPATETSLLVLRSFPPSDPSRIKAVLPSNDALDAALDKNKTLQLANSKGIRVPATRLIRDIKDTVGPVTFPVVLKPRHSKVFVRGKLTTIAAEIIEGEHQRRRWLDQWLPHTEVMQQEYITGKAIGVELLYDSGKRIWHFAHERLHELPLTGGASSYRRSIPVPADALEIADSLLEALKWHGVAMVEFKRDSTGKFWLLEINPRLWGSLALAIDAGVNFPVGLLKLARKESLPCQPRYTAFYYSRDFPNDLRWFRYNLFASRGNRLLLTRPRLRSFVEWSRPLLGRESWDHFDSRDLRITALLFRNGIRDHLAAISPLFRNLAFNLRARRHHRQVLQRLASGPKPQRILFLCHGNICRSPIAERLAQNYLPDVASTSAALAESNGRECPPMMIHIGSDLGLDLTGHRSRRVTKSQIENADLILVMDQANFTELADRFPDALPRTTMLSLFSGRKSSIQDPFQSYPEKAAQVAHEIRSAIVALGKWLRGFESFSPIAPRSGTEGTATHLTC